MLEQKATTVSSKVFPALRYQDAPAAIEWLGRAFGFEKHLVVPNADGTIAHAQMRFGNGMIMLGSVRDGEDGLMMKQPDEIGGAETVARRLRLVPVGIDQRRGADLVELGPLVGAQRQRRGGQVVSQLVAGPGADDQGGYGGPAEEVGQGYLGG